MLHVHLHLLAHRVELGASDHAILVGVGAGKEAAHRGRMRLGRLAALGLGVLALRSFRLGLGDLPVVVGVKPIEHLRGIEMRDALLDLLVTLRIDGVQLILGDEAVVVGVELGERRCGVLLNVGARRRHCCVSAMSASRGRRLRRRGAGECRAGGENGGSCNTAHQNLLHLSGLRLDQPRR
jgi:hypothetical protein